MKMTVQERFDSKRMLNPDTGCIEWIGRINEYGYGIFDVYYKKKKNMLAHRWAWLEERGEIPDGFCVLHICDNRRCTNVDHLFLGTRVDNNLDRQAKGRTSRGEKHSKAVRAVVRDMAVGQRNGAYTHPEKVLRGESHGSSKLNNDLVLYIREKYEQGGVSYHDLAVEIGVTKANIRNVIKRWTWAHVA